MPARVITHPRRPTATTAAPPAVSTPSGSVAAPVPLYCHMSLTLQRPPDGSTGVGSTTHVGDDNCRVVHQPLSPQARAPGPTATTAYRVVSPGSGDAGNDDLGASGLRASDVMSYTYRHRHDRTTSQHVNSQILSQPTSAPWFMQCIHVSSTHRELHVRDDQRVTARCGTAQRCRI